MRKRFPHLAHMILFLDGGLFLHAPCWPAVIGSALVSAAIYWTFIGLFHELVSVPGLRRRVAEMEDQLWSRPRAVPYRDVIDRAPLVRARI